MMLCSTTTITPPIRSGPTAEAMLKRAFCPWPGSIGISIGSELLIDSARGGRLNAIVPCRLACRTGSTGSGAAGVAIVNATSPASIIEPGSISAGAAIRRPSTQVPLAEPRSVTVARRPPGVAAMLK